MRINRFRRVAFRLGCAVITAVGLTVGLPAVHAPSAAAAPALPAGFVLNDVPSGQSPYDLTDFAFLPDGSALTTGKGGRLAWAPTDGRSTRTLATLPTVTDGDLGLVSVAVAPDYSTSKHIYLIRSVPGVSVVRVARWTVTGGTEPTGITGEQTVLEGPIDVPTHAITGIVPAADGTLWISNGDNASPGFADPRALRSRELDALQGKLLHVTADGKGVPGNPFYDPANPDSVRSKVFAKGLRSPFRLSLDPTNGLPVVGDVGWNAWEEVNVVRPGQDYAWPCWEGNSQPPGYQTMAACAGVPNNSPLWTYQHGGELNQGNSVTGGVVYTGTTYPPQYRGAYFFADYVGKKLWALRYDANGNLTQVPQSPPLGVDIGGAVKFDTAPNGDLVYADLDNGTLRRLKYGKGNTTPIAKATTSTDPATRTVTFDASQSTDFDTDPLTYRWDFGDGTTGSGVTATHTYAEGTGRLTAKLTVTDNHGAAASTDVVVAPTNHSPVLTVTDPGERTFAVHERVAASATATDAEDGPLTVQWTTNVVHCPETATCHAHPGPGGTGPNFEIPFTDHPDSRVDVIATVTDKEGVQATRTYAARPRQHRVTLKGSVPAAMQIPSEGGVPSALVTEGATIDAVAPATASDGTSSFAGWADGPTGTTRQLTVGATDITLTANYTTPIDRRFNTDEPLRNLLGAPTGPETVDVGGRYREHERGRLYWSAATGVHEVHGAILATYLSQGGASKWGLPLSDETTTPDGIGRYNVFQNNASAYWSPNTGAHIICCQNRDKWAATGWELGYLGYPTSSELVEPDGIGHYNEFANNGSIYWTPTAGSQALCCQIRDKWRAMGGPTSYLGYPETSEARTPDGVGAYVHFQNRGSIYWSPWTGAVATCCQIRDRWAALGWERSYLGYPASDEFQIPEGVRANYQRGYIIWRRQDGAVFDYPY